MIRNRISLAIAAALIATVALAGCKKKDDMATTTPPATTEPAPAPVEPAPAPAATSSVLSVDLGNAVGADNKVTMASTTFATKDTIHASVATDGAGGKLNAKWTYQDGQTVHEDSRDLNLTGDGVTAFQISKPDGFPAGRYKVEVSLDGTVVQSKDFEVK